MNIIDTHEHRLVFRIDTDAPKEYIKKWKDFKLECEGRKQNLPGSKKKYLNKLKKIAN